MAKAKMVEDLVGGEDDEAPGIGHNSKTPVGSDLQSIIDRIERLTEEKKELQRDITEIYQESKGRGYEPKIIRQIIKLRAMSQADRAEQEALLDTYMSALGMLD